MGWLSFWNDGVSRKLELEKKDAASLWKASNLLLKSGLLIFLIGIILVVLAASELISSGIDFSSGFSINPSSQIFMTAPLALLAILASTALLSLYVIAVALLAAVFNEFGWAGFIFVFGVPAPYYKYKKGRELYRETQGNAGKPGLATQR